MQLGVDQLTGVHGGTVQKEAGLSPDILTRSHIIFQRGISGGILLLLIIIKNNNIVNIVFIVNIIQGVHLRPLDNNDLKNSKKLATILQSYQSPTEPRARIRVRVASLPGSGCTWNDGQVWGGKRWCEGFRKTGLPHFVFLSD